MISLKWFAPAQTWNEDAMELSYDADSAPRQEDEIEIDLDLTDGNLQDVENVADEDVVENYADFYSSSNQHIHSNVQDDGDFATESHVPERERSTRDHSEMTGIGAAHHFRDVNDQNQGEEEDVIVDDLLDETDDASGTLKDMEGGGDLSGSSAPHDGIEVPDTDIPIPLEQLRADGNTQVVNGDILPTNMLTRDLDKDYQETAVAARLSRADERLPREDRLRLPAVSGTAGADFDASDGLTAFESVPTAPQPSAKSSSPTSVSPPRSPPQRASIRVPIHVTYQETEMSLFPSFDLDQEHAQTYLLEDDDLVYQRIKILMQACRSVLGDSITADDELILSLPEIDLHITEPSTTEMDMSLADVVDLHVQLHANDGKEETPSIYLNLTSKPNQFNHWNHLKAAAREGKGINSIQMATSFTYDDTESFPVQDIGESAVSKANGMSSEKDERRVNSHGKKSPSSAAVEEIVDENVYPDRVEDLPSHGNSDGFLGNEDSTMASSDAAAYIKARRTSTSTLVEVLASSSQKPYPQSNSEDGRKGEDTQDQDSIQESPDSPQLLLSQDENSSNQKSSPNKTISDGAFNHCVDDDGYVTEQTVEHENERTKAVDSNPDEIEDLDDWDEEEGREAAPDAYGNVSGSVPLTESHELFTKITNSGIHQFSVHDENTDEYESVYDGRRPSHQPPGHIAQDCAVPQTSDAGNADDTLPEEDRTPTGISGAASSVPRADEHHQDASEPFVTGPMGSGNADTVTVGGSSAAVTDNEAGEASRSAGIKDTKDFAPSRFLDVAASDEDGTIFDKEQLPGDILIYSTSDNPPALASALLKRSRNASEDEPPTGVDLHDVKRARSSQHWSE